MLGQILYILLPSLLVQQTQCEARKNDVASDIEILGQRRLATIIGATTGATSVETW
jgi:hypothetical protein